MNDREGGCRTIQTLPAPFVEEKPVQSVDELKIARSSICRSSERHDWETPPDLFDMLNREFGFNLDVAASAENAKCKEFLTIRENGLAVSWNNRVCWMNPPYGRDLPRWMRKAYSEAKHHNATVVCLVPARTHTKWFHSLCLEAEVRFLRGRLRYVGADGEAPFAQLVIVFRPGSRSGELGRPWVMKPWEHRPLTKQTMLDWG